MNFSPLENRERTAEESMILQRTYLDQWRFTPVDIYRENKSARTLLLFVGINVSATVFLTRRVGANSVIELLS